MPPTDRDALTKHDLELGPTFAPRFDEHGLIPCVAQHADTGRVLMFAYMNRQSLDLTIETGEVHYWSRSRGKLWKKGESSGMVQRVRELLVDCDQDVILAKVVVGDGKTVPQAACHTGYESCFYRQINADGSLRLVEEEKAFDPEAVY